MTTMVTGRLRVLGRFDGEKVALLEPAPRREPCDVVVDFELTEEARRQLLESAIGGWCDDARTTDEIIAGIYEARTLGREEIKL